VPGDPESAALDQVTLISRLLEGAPKAVIHDYTVNGGTATLKYSLPGEVTIWKITLQTAKAARLAELASTSSTRKDAP
jgi:hypothetical protein